MSKINDILLIHGAWHAGWCFSKLKILFSEKKNITIHIIDLPGHGENLYPKDNLSNITLQSYVNFICNYVQNKNKKFTLIGHSMAGVIISLVAQKIPEYIDHLIYLSSFIPLNHSSLLSMGQIAQPYLISNIQINKKKYFLLPPNAYVLKKFFYNQIDTNQLSYLIKNLQHQPLKPFLQSTKNVLKDIEQIPKTYIHTFFDYAIPLKFQKEMSSYLLNCQFFTLYSDHSPFLTSTEKLYNLLYSRVSNHFN